MGLEKIFDDSAERIIKWFNTPANLDNEGNPQEDVFYDTCCDPNHWWEGVLPEQHVKPIKPINGSFVKFDYEHYEPSPQSKDRILTNHLIDQYNEPHVFYKAIRFIAECLSMNKTLDDRKAEWAHEQEWKAGGIKSWR